MQTEYIQDEGVVVSQDVQWRHKKGEVTSVSAMSMCTLTTGFAYLSSLYASTAVATTVHKHCDLVI